MPEGRKEYPRRFPIIVGLWHESLRPRSNLLPAHAIDVAAEERRHVFEKTAAGTQGGKVCVRHVRATSGRHWRKTDLHVLAISTKARLQEVRGKRRHVIRSVSMVGELAFHE